MAAVDGPLAGPTSTGDAGFLVASLDGAGGCNWNVMTGMTQGEIGTDVAIDHRGNVILTGEFFGIRASARHGAVS
ncbi:hypothetical protein WME91_17240 [Sorangium sp. So ce269]